MSVYGNVYLQGRAYNGDICPMADILYMGSTVKQLSRNTIGESALKDVFTTNWYIYKIYQPSSKPAHVQHTRQQTDQPYIRHGEE